MFSQIDYGAALVAQKLNSIITQKCYRATLITELDLERNYRECMGTFT